MAITASLVAQDQIHGRKYKPPPEVAHIVVTVQKGFNSKPFPNAAVIFRSIKDGKDNGNLEVKTDSEGRAMIDLIEKGSHVHLQVIATGFATYAEDFDVPGDQKELLVKLQRPRAQVSAYGEEADKPSQTAPGVQEPPKATKPKPVTPPPAASTTTPPAGPQQ